MDILLLHLRSEWLCLGLLPNQVWRSLLKRPSIELEHLSVIRINHHHCWRKEGRRDGGMEGWRDGGMEGWKEGRRDGGMEGWMEGWRDLTFETTPSELEHWVWIRKGDCMSSWPDDNTTVALWIPESHHDIWRSHDHQCSSLIGVTLYTWTAIKDTLSFRFLSSKGWCVVG